MHKNHYLFIIPIIEIIFSIIFHLIKPRFIRSKGFDFNSFFKGLFERIFITYSLISGLPHALTLFGALKLGTRLKRSDETITEIGKKEEGKYNDYYLIGNLISVTMSIFYYNLLK
jgi:hypothetical protein